MIKKIIHHAALPLVFVLMSMALPTLVSHAAHADNAESILLNHVDKAQNNLSATERRIAKERQQFSIQINKLELEVLALRDKTAVARRLADEKTLSLSQLEERTESWQQQHAYQQNLLHRFLQQYGKQALISFSGSEPSSQSPTVVAQIKAAVQTSVDIEKRFSPRWEVSDIVVPSGEISPSPTLAIGPVTWFWNEREERAGLASQHNNIGLHSDLLLGSSDSNAIASLRTQTLGELIFDPTLNRAMAREQHSESLYDHIVKGGLWVVPILLFALFALSIALVKVAQLWRLPKLVRFTPAALKSVLYGQGLSTSSGNTLTARVKGMQKQLLDTSMTTVSARERDDQLFMQLQEQKHILERWIGAIAITAAVSPLLGLLGTVSGMIETFKMMTLFGSGDPEVVSGGIAQALVTTELGLVVAIPALILNAILSRRAKTYYNDLESFAILISKADERDVLPSTQNRSPDPALTSRKTNNKRPSRSGTSTTGKISEVASLKTGIGTPESAIPEGST